MGLGNRAAAKAIHLEASPGLRLRPKAHGPLQIPPPASRPHCACVYRHSPIACTHTQKELSEVSTTHRPTPVETLHAHGPVPALRVTEARKRPGHETQHPRARPGRARARALDALAAACSASLLPRPRPPRSPPTGQARKGEAAARSQVPPSPLAKLRPARPLPLATAGDPFRRPTPHWLKQGTARPFAVMEPGTPITSSPPHLPVSTAPAGRAPPPLRGRSGALTRPREPSTVPSARGAARGCGPSA